MFQSSPSLIIINFVSYVTTAFSFGNTVLPGRGVVSQSHTLCFVVIRFPRECPGGDVICLGQGRTDLRLTPESPQPNSNRQINAEVLHTKYMLVGWGCEYDFDQTMDICECDTI